jgi:hypothetical protein
VQTVMKTAESESNPPKPKVRWLTRLMLWSHSNGIKDTSHVIFEDKSNDVMHFFLGHDWYCVIQHMTQNGEQSSSCCLLWNCNHKQDIVLFKNWNCFSILTLGLVGSVGFSWGNFLLKYNRSTV